jgi:hypothetical protein
MAQDFSDEIVRKFNRELDDSEKEALSDEGFLPTDLENDRIEPDDYDDFYVWESDKDKN